MQVAHVEDSAKINSVRGAEREFRTLLIGDETALDNFRLYFVRQSGEVDVPRHKHNFDQIRMCLEGGRQNYGADKWIAPGEIAYFPEGTPYGPEQSNTERLSITLQFGGASGNGFVSSARLQQAMNEMKELGTFEKGIFKRTGQLAAGEKRNQDSYEAIWEHVNKRKLVYPKPRYGEPILIKPENFEWETSKEHPGFARKWLCAFSERHLQFAVAKLEAGAPRAAAVAWRHSGRLRPAGRGSGQWGGDPQVLGFFGQGGFGAELRSRDGGLARRPADLRGAGAARIPDRGRIGAPRARPHGRCGAAARACRKPSRFPGAVLSGQADQGAGRLSAGRRERPLRPRRRRWACAPRRGQAERHRAEHARCRQRRCHEQLCKPSVSRRHHHADRHRPAAGAAPSRPRRRAREDL